MSRDWVIETETQRSRAKKFQNIPWRFNEFIPSPFLWMYRNGFRFPDAMNKGTLLRIERSSFRKLEEEEGRKKRIESLLHGSHPLELERN